MELGGYEGLKDAKSALQEGLIGEDDYEDMKVAYLRAQQIRAGLDAGFLREGDYQAIKRAFLNSLNLSDPSVGAGLRFSNGTAVSYQLQQGDRGQDATIQQIEPASTATAPDPAAGRASQVRSKGIRNEQQNGSLPAQATKARANNFAPPATIPKISGARSRPPNATSMSGIAVLDDAVDMYYYLKQKQDYTWAIWRINDAGNQVVIDSAGPQSSSYEDFLGRLPPSDCRYAVMDLQFTNSDGCVFNKILFVNWAPDAAKMRGKMMYASTKDFFKSHLDGIAAEVQAGNLSDITEQEAQAAVKANVTRL